jgi:Flp pilus assembly protein TadD, contains TPR repeats
MTAQNDRQAITLHSRASWWARRLSLLLLVVIPPLIAYENSFAIPYLCDDSHEIGGNERLHSLANLPASVFEGNMVPARPLPYLTFAINYTIHQDHPWGYHLINLVLHVFNAILIANIVQLSLTKSRQLWKPFEGLASVIAWSTASIWVTLPVHTLAVSFIYQRIELLMSTMFLLTLLLFMSAIQSPKRSLQYLTLSLLSCYAGALSKEAIATAPLMVLWYDRVFVSSSWKQLWNARKTYYLALAGTWLIIYLVILPQKHLYGEFGGNTNISRWEYLLTQTRVILHYVKQVFLPEQLTFDYSFPMAFSISDVAGPFAILTAIAALAVSGMRFFPKISFLIGAFFLLLGPTSSLQPVSEFVKDYRIYLASVPLLLAVILPAALLFDNLSKCLANKNTAQKSVKCVLMVIAVAMQFHNIPTVWSRNEVMTNPTQFWNDNIDKVPTVFLPHLILYRNMLAGQDLEGMRHHFDEFLNKIEQYNSTNRNRFARRIDLSYREWIDMVFMLSRRGKSHESIDWARNYQQSRPERAEPWIAEASVTLNDDPSQTEWLLITAYNKQPENAQVNHMLGGFYLSQNNYDKAILYCQQTVKLEPSHADAWNNLGIAFSHQQRFREATNAFSQALTIEPTHPEAAINLNAISQRFRSFYR